MTTIGFATLARSLPNISDSFYSLHEEDPSLSDNNLTENTDTEAQSCHLEPDDNISLPSADEHFKCFTKKGLHFIHLNVRSLLPKFEELKVIANKTKAAVIILTETWLDGSIPSGEIDIDGYTIVRRDRNCNGGGVCAYINNNITYTERPDLDNPNLEAVWLEILLPKTRPIVVGGIYRQPSQTNFLEEMEKVLSLIRTECESYILGDFNICMKSYNSSPLLREYSNLLQNFSFVQIIDEPTRIFANMSTIIDHILCNDKEKVVQQGSICIGLSDHNLIYCTGKVSKIPINRHNTIKIRSLKNFLLQNLKMLTGAVFCVLKMFIKIGLLLQMFLLIF